MGLKQTLIILIALQAMPALGDNPATKTAGDENPRVSISPKYNKNAKLNLPFSIETEHYIVKSDISEKVVQNTAKALEQLYKQFELMFKPEGGADEKVEVGLFSTQLDFMNHMLKNGYNASETTVGLFIPFRDGSGRILVYKRQDEYHTLNTLYHEATHQFVHRVLYEKQMPPTWLNEGLAVYFENSRWEKGKFKTGLLPRTRLKNLKERIRNDRFIPLADLLTRQNDDFDANCCGESWALVHFFAKSNNGAFVKRFNAYFKMLRAGDEPMEAFKKCFPSIEKLEPVFKKYVMDLKLPAAD